MQPICPLQLRPAEPTNATDVIDFCEEGGHTHTAVQPTYADFIGDLQFVSVPDGAELAYYRFGNSTSGRPALVLVAGFGDTMSLWTVPFLEHLARDQEVIMFDNRGMGFSKVRRRHGWHARGGGSRAVSGTGPACGPVLWPPAPGS